MCVDFYGLVTNYVNFPLAQNGRTAGEERERTKCNIFTGILSIGSTGHTPCRGMLHCESAACSACWVSASRVNVIIARQGQYLIALRDDRKKFPLPFRAPFTRCSRLLALATASSLFRPLSPLSHCRCPRLACVIRNAKVNRMKPQK